MIFFSLFMWIKTTVMILYYKKDKFSGYRHIQYAKFNYS